MPVNPNDSGLFLTGMLPCLNYDEQDFFDTKNSMLLFARGFLICKNNQLKITPHFEKIKLNEYTLYHHKFLDVSHFKKGSAEVYLLGVAYFVDEKYISKKVNCECETLCRELAKSTYDFFEAVECLAGRYVIVCKNGGEYFLINDASGLKPCFFSKSEFCVGSHLELVNLVAKKEISAVEKNRIENNYVYNYSYLGNCTIYDDIFLLTPDFSLSLNDFCQTRFFPRKKLTKTDSVLDVKNRFLKLMEISITELRRKGKNICMSLTGGKDSRISLYSTFKYKDEMFFFTESRDNDLSLSEKLAKKYGLRWQGCSPLGFRFGDNPYKKGFDKILEKNVFPKTARYCLQTQFWTLCMFGIDSPYIHIHSNCAETARGRPNVAWEYPHFGKEYGFDLFKKDFIESCVAWHSEEIKARQRVVMNGDKFFLSALKEYFDFLDLDFVKELGYNPWDFMYSEQRTAGFLSQVHVINDCAFESVSLTNCRKVFSTMWELPENKINKSCVLYNTILEEFENIYPPPANVRTFRRKRIEIRKMKNLVRRVA